MKIETEQRLAIAVCSTEVIPLGVDTNDVDMRCGAAMVAAPRPAPEVASGSVLGKRYADKESGLELLVTDPGEGTFSVGHRLLAVKEARKLSSTA